MTQVPAGNELIRPFVPTLDFELSKQFYEALGFEKALDGEVAISTRARAASSFSGIIKRIGPKIP
jgi:hypothetical protein